MLVLNTIELRKISEDELYLETPVSLRLMGAFIVSFPLYLLILSSGHNYSSKSVIIVCLYVFILIGMFFVGKFKRVIFDKKNKIVSIKLSFFFYPFRKYIIPFSELKDVINQESSYGQTFQTKRRIILKKSDQQFDLGIINNKIMAEKIQSTLKEFITD